MTTPPACQCNHGATGLPRFAWKVAIKTAYVRFLLLLIFCLQSAGMHDCLFFVTAEDLSK